MNPEIIAEFYETLKTAHRIYGQFKRVPGFEVFYGSSSFETLTGYKIPKRITPGSINMLKKNIRQMYILKEHYEYDAANEWKSALQASFEQFEESNNAAQSATDSNKNKFIADLMENGLRRLYNAVYDAYMYAYSLWTGKFKEMNRDESIIKGKEYKESIEKFMVNFGEKLKKFAYAVVDTKEGGFNTNVRFWKKDDIEGQKGRSRFKAFAIKLCEAWWISDYSDQLIQAATLGGV